MNRLALVSALALLAGCPKPQQAARPSYSGPPRAYKLLGEVPEAETAARTEKRGDLFVSTEQGEPVPLVVGTGQVGPITLNGARAKLYGDEAGKEGFSVDNFILIEVYDAKNQLVDSMAVGYQNGTTRGAEVIDAVGGNKFNFGPGEVDITRKLPTNEPFTLKATALDVGGVGRVSNVYVIVAGEAGSGDPVDEIKENL